jgi:16S rRNA (uracil1498-N3)-methyltransferase
MWAFPLTFRDSADFDATVRVAETTFFYAPPDRFDGSAVVLPPDEAHHAIRVLRVGIGDEIQVVDGLGGWFRVVLESSDKSGARGRIVERRMGLGEPSVYVHLAVAGLKSRSRFDMLVEKATEIGVSRISVLDTERSERFRFDEERVERVMRAAMKQCKRSRIPLFDGPLRWTDFISSSGEARRVVFHEESGEVPVSTVFRPGDRHVVITVGPEGGFTTGEIEQAVRAGFKVVRLGERRLRTETASLFACSAAIMLSNSK